MKLIPLNTISPQYHTPFPWELRNEGFMGLKSPPVSAVFQDMYSESVGGRRVGRVALQNG